MTYMNRYRLIYTLLLTALMKIKIKDVNGYEELPLGNLPLGNILYLCGVKQ